MNRQEAVALAVTISDSWPGRGITPERWADKLEPLELVAASRAIDDLMNTDEQPPSWAKFYAAYRAKIPTPERFKTPCGRCEGTGWRQFTRYREGYGDYSAACPCDCSNGRQHDAAFTRALDANDANARRTAPASALTPGAIRGPQQPPTQEAVDF